MFKKNQPGGYCLVLLFFKLYLAKVYLACAEVSTFANKCSFYLRMKTIQTKNTEMEITSEKQNKYNFMQIPGRFEALTNFFQPSEMESAQMLESTRPTVSNGNGLNQLVRKTCGQRHKMDRLQVL